MQVHTFRNGSLFVADEVYHGRTIVDGSGLHTYQFKTWLYIHIRFTQFYTQHIAIYVLQGHPFGGGVVFRPLGKHQTAQNHAVICFGGHVDSDACHGSAMRLNDYAGILGCCNLGERYFQCLIPDVRRFVVNDTVAVGGCTDSGQIHCDNLITFIYNLHLQCLGLSWLHTQVKVTQIITNLVVRQNGAHIVANTICLAGSRLHPKSWDNSQRHQDDHNHDEQKLGQYFFLQLF